MKENQQKYVEKSDHLIVNIKLPSYNNLPINILLMDSIHLPYSTKKKKKKTPCLLSIHLSLTNDVPNSWN